MNCEIDGVKYVSARATDFCEGCVAATNSPLCGELPFCAGIIWLKATQPELTDDEILEICDKFGWEQGDWIKCIRAAIEADRAKR